MFPPFLDIGNSFLCGLASLRPTLSVVGVTERGRGAPAQREPTAATRSRREVQHPHGQSSSKSPVHDQHEHAVSANDRIAGVRHVDGHTQFASLVEVQPHALLRSQTVLGEEPSQFGACALTNLHHQVRPSPASCASATVQCCLAAAARRSLRVGPYRRRHCWLARVMRRPTRGDAAGSNLRNTARDRCVS